MVGAPGLTARVLDGCSGAGGAARGYALGGHDVWGIDSDPDVEDHYLTGARANGRDRFRALDILDVLSRPGIARNSDFIHVSPPCQFNSAMSSARPGLADKYPDLIGPVREALIDIGLPFVIENVEAARSWLKDPVMLCAQMFQPGVLLYRHRLFEAGGGSSWPSRRCRLRACQGHARHAAGLIPCRPAGQGTGYPARPSQRPATSATSPSPAR
ncbi:MAG TPA: hypothetical protein VMU94_20165 [Streptosporangiaceae bacterium]|nr:hypothetical protein [Streptosporangiaceae bacterium]